MSENNEGDLVGGRWNRPVGTHRMGVSPKVGKNWFVCNFLNQMKVKNEIVAEPKTSETSVARKARSARKGVAQMFQSCKTN